MIELGAHGPRGGGLFYRGDLLRIGRVSGRNDCAGVTVILAQKTQKEKF